MKKPSRRTETESRPKAKRPQASGYGTNSKRKTYSEDNYTTRTKPKATLDGGERPIARRRSTTDEETKPFKKTASSLSKPPVRRGTAAKTGQEETRPVIKVKYPRRDEEDGNSSRPKRRGYNSGFSLKEASAKGSRPVRRSATDGEASEESDSRKGEQKKYSSYKRPVAADSGKRFGGEKKPGNGKVLLRKKEFSEGKEYSGEKKFGSKRDLDVKAAFDTKKEFGFRKEADRSKRFDREKDSAPSRPTGDAKKTVQRVDLTRKDLSVSVMIVCKSTRLPSYS